MTSVLDTELVLPEETHLATLRQVLEEAFDTRVTSAARELKDLVEPLVSKARSSETVRDFGQIEKAFKGFFGRLLKEDNVLGVDHAFSWPSRDGGRAVDRVTLVFDEREKTIRALTLHTWSSLVVSPLGKMSESMGRRAVQQAAITYRRHLEVSMDASRVWLRKELREKVRDDFSRRHIEDLAAQASSASIAASEATIVMADQGRKTLAWARFAAGSAFVTFLVYVLQALLGLAQIGYTKNLLELTKCGDTTQTRAVVVPDIVCPPPEVTGKGGHSNSGEASPAVTPKSPSTTSSSSVSTLVR